MASCSPRRREGGASAVAMELARELGRRGHSVEILFQEDVAPSPFLPKRFEELSFAVGVARHILRNPEGYDVVNLRAPTGCVYGFARRFARKGPPYVVELDGLEERRAYAIRQEMRKGRAWDSKLKNRLWHRLYHLPRFRMSVKTADWAVCATREIWSYLQLVYRLRYERVTYLPHGVDERFIRLREYPAFRSPKLLYVGTWLEQRGTQYIIEAMSELARRLPGIRLTIVGCILKPDEILAPIPSPVKECVDVIPFVPSAQMPDIYARHDIFLFPSFFEALPLVLLEAMAAGMSVISTETCGMMDAVRDGWNGILVSPGDSEAIIAAVLRLTADPKLRRHLGLNAQETARWFSWERISKTLESVLERVVRQVNEGKVHNA
jgi:glycosyltransferase involved in cell wall biosynthesis